jgi:hypothetical protein
MKCKTDDFITKARLIHGNKYDYTKTVYVNSCSKLIITCLVHGDFEQVGYNHLKGQGCRKCVVNKSTKTTDDFIKESKEIHNNKYLYGNVDYINAKSKVLITCPKHGNFEQQARSHLSGQGCRKCSNLEITLSEKEFIEKARKLHGSKYGYDKVQYINGVTKIIITCHVHGDFTQRADSHLQGIGCPDCSPKSIKATTNEFVDKAIEVHGNKYDYSKVNYIGCYEDVIITCPLHGEFRQKPSIHLSGSGCKTCGYEKVRDTLKISCIDFISKADKIHGSLYDYSKVVYVTTNSKVIIGCKKHGDFLQTPNNHLQGSNCPSCKASKGELLLRLILQKHNINFIQEYTIPNYNVLGSSRRFFYDFYLPDHKLLIEFHGIQHYKAIGFFGGKEALKETKLRDRLKKDFARLAGLSLISFNYIQLKRLGLGFEKAVIARLTLQGKSNGNK